MKKITLILVFFVLLAAGFYASSIHDSSLFFEEPEKPVEKPVEVLPEIVWGNKEKQQIIFTFDAGSGIQSLNGILNTLEKYSLKGTFFITGKWAEQNPDLVKRISDAGHEIFNHTYSHPYLTQITDEEIVSELNRADQIISNITGATTKPYFRTPYGDRNSNVLKVSAIAGYRAVYWTVDVLDWKEDQGFTAEQAKARIMDNLKPGTIYLMHIGDNLTGQILDDVFSQIQSRGYSIVSLTQGI